MLLFAGGLCGQTEPDTVSGLPFVTTTDSLPAIADTLPPLQDSLPPSTPEPFSGRANINWDEVKLSPDAPEEQIDYSARDSMFFDLQNKQIHLYGDAKVDYQAMNMTANYILIDWNENTMTAEGKRSPAGSWIGKPTFVQGSQNFTASRLRYNFKTYKGIIFDAQTIQEGMNVVGTKGKFIGAGDDTTKSNVIYNRDAIFSTCDLEQPHFGIHSNKQKVVQDKVAIVGPSNIEIGGIPTPLWLPFGFFPMTTGKRTGLIFPQDYQYSEAWGFGLEGVGWFLPMSDYWDLTLTSDIYLKGTFRMHGRSTYRKRYKYNGNAGLSVAYLRTEVDGRPVFNPSLSMRWSHTQDQKAHPYRTFGGNINIQTSDFQRSNRTDAESRFQSTLTSNMSYRQRFDQPFDLSMNFSHSQNTNTRDVLISFPQVAFQTQTLFPFKRKLQTGGEKWFERISMRYSSEAKNQFMAKDSTIFTQQTLDDAQFGVRHDVNTQTNFSLLKYFNFTPNASYKEVWYFRSVDKTFDPTPTVTIDTIYNEDSTELQFVADTSQFGQVIDMENFGFKPFRQYNIGMGMSTKIFGTVLFKRGKLKGLRHVITPNFSFSYSPDYTNPDWGYFQSVRTDLRTEEELQYDIFEVNRLAGFSRPPPGGRQMLLTYGLQHLFEAKVFSKKTGKDKIVKLFQTLNMGGSYNFAADSLKWSQVSLSGNQSFFNRITTFRFSMTYDPYDRNPATGRRINEFYQQNTGKLLRLDNWNSTITTNMTVGRLRDLIAGVNTDQRVANEPQDEGPKEEDFLSLFENFSINHNFTVRRQYFQTIQKDSVVIAANTLSTRGTIRLTPNWFVNVGNIGYDFQSKRITYPDFTFSRDLHCWEMGLSWQPYFDTYGFYIRVKPGHLDFINIPYGKRIQDGQRRF